MKTIKIILLGVINFVIRFGVAGFLLMGVQMDPVGCWFGFLLTLIPLVVSFVFLKYLIKPASLKEALSVALLWVVIAILLDMITAKPIVHVDIPSLFRELQFWTRVIIILVIAPFTVRKN